MFAEAFAGIAASISSAIGGPYHAARVLTVTDATFDEGGSIADPGNAVERVCMCQVDAATEAMRLQTGFTERDVRLLIISLAGDLDTSARVVVDGGPHAGAYSVESVARDPVAAYWECRGRAAN